MSAAQRELPGLRPQIPISMQEQIVVQRQQNVMETASMASMSSTTTVTASLPVILSTGGVIRNLPDIAPDTKTGLSTISATSGIPTEIVVVNAQPAVGTPTVETKVVYSLSEMVMKEKDSLFKEDQDSVFTLEPPRSENQTVRMRSKNFFTVLEEEEDGEEKKSVADSVNNETAAQLKINCPKYTPIFNVGQNLHQIFNSQNRRKQRQNKALVKPEDSGEKSSEPVKHETQATHSPRPSSSGYESDPEHFVQLYEKITINPAGLRRNSSQPNLQNCTADEFMELEGLVVPKSHSQSMPTTPRVSPRLQRRNSASSSDMVKPKILKPEATGPGLSFLASVAGELRSQKKRYSDKQILETQTSKVNQDTQVAKATQDTSVQTKKEKVGIVGNKQEVKIVEKARPIRGHIFKSSSSTESSPSTSPKRNNVWDEMKLSSGNQQATGSKKTFMQSIVGWGTTPTSSVTNKESNMFSPTSF